MSKKNVLLTIIFLTITFVTVYFGTKIAITGEQSSKMVVKNDVNKEQSSIHTNNEEVRIPNTSQLSGGYSPKKDVILGDYKIALFEIRLSEDRSRVSDVIFLIRKVNDIKYMNFLHCSYFNVASGQILIKAENSPVGSISLEGTFLPATKGDYWLVSHDTPVLKGKLTVKNNENIVYEEDQNFTFVIGE